MALLHLLSYAGGLAAFLFVTLSLASGLLWLAELIEEHSRYAKTVGKRAIYTIIALHLLLAITDGLPIPQIIFSIACHVVYLQNFSATWPYISLTSLKFIASCILVVADHFMWFFHFAAKAQEAKRYRKPTYRYGGKMKEDGGVAFMDVAAFFAICVWFVPLFLFLSLSANDNALPSFGDSSAPSSPNVKPSTIDLSTPNLSGPRAQQYGSRQSLIKTILNPVFGLLPRIGRRRGPKNEEGLIAPRTPIRGSPIHSPVAMPNSYFPWGEENTSFTNSNTLTPEARSGSGSSSASHATRTPPPPRRVQSEAQISGRGLNPRGIAVRGGVPAVPDSVLPDEPVAIAGEDSLGLVGSISGRGPRKVPTRPSSPSMSLGPQGADKVGDSEIITSKRKAD